MLSCRLCSTTLANPPKRRAPMLCKTFQVKNSLSKLFAQCMQNPSLANPSSSSNDANSGTRHCAGRSYGRCRCLACISFDICRLIQFYGLLRNRFCTLLLYPFLRPFLPPCWHGNISPVTVHPGAECFVTTCKRHNFHALAAQEPGHRTRAHSPAPTVYSQYWCLGSVTDCTRARKSGNRSRCCNQGFNFGSYVSHANLHGSLAAATRISSAHLSPLLITEQRQILRTWYMSLGELSRRAHI
mmetsp:Transcript_78216/g.142273  ORF Transcript_78216/g.142273 Transcript_78216/m.142273 type:complete len:242 (-) Transcript_78216:62-787(-)